VFIKFIKDLGLIPLFINLNIFIKFKKGILVALYINNI